MRKHRKFSQDVAILGFMRKHVDVARNFTKGDRVAVAAEWEDLTMELNAMGPPMKTAAEWKIVWKDWKAAIKKKISNNNKQRRATGSGPFRDVPLTSIEEEIAQICNMFEAVEGTAGVKKFGLQEVFESKENLKKENVEIVEVDETTPKKTKLDTNYSYLKGNNLEKLVVAVNSELKEIKEELVKMSEDRKKTNVLLERIAVALENNGNKL